MPRGHRFLRPLRAYTSVAVRAFRRHATYRGATFAGVVTNTVFGFVYAFVFLAVHSTTGDIEGFTATDTALYVFIAQAFLAMTAAFGDREISERIRSGDIAADLYRPVDFQAWWLAHDLGRAGFQLIFRGIPPFVIGAVVLGLPVPADPARWLWFAATLAPAVVVAFAIRFMANISGFWLLEARGVIALTALAQLFFAGHVVPLYFMPDALESLARILPFAGITALPAEVLLGAQAGPDVLAFQAVWITVLLVAGRMMFRAAQRRLVVQGG